MIKSTARLLSAALQGNSNAERRDLALATFLSASKLSSLAHLRSLTIVLVENAEGVPKTARHLSHALPKCRSNAKMRRASVLYHSARITLRQSVRRGSSDAQTKAAFSLFHSVLTELHAAKVELSVGMRRAHHHSVPVLIRFSVRALAVLWSRQ